MIVVDQLTIQQGDFILRDVSFTIPTGQYGVLMGRTGSGKTTLLECIAGLRAPTRGRIRLGDRDVTALPPAIRGVGYVPQDGALFPHMTVADHLAFALRIRGWSRPDIDQRVAGLAVALGIDHLLARFPARLSGGESQRVALGRALSFRPDVLLLDEPLAALDEETRDQMIELMRSITQREHVTAFHVTHSRREADQLGDVRIQL